MLISPNCSAKIRRLVAVKLQQAKVAFADGAKDKLFGWVHKHADAQGERRQCAGNFRRYCGRNEPRAAVIKVEAQRVRARLDGNQRVRRIGDPANFDPHTHL